MSKLPLVEGVLNYIQENNIRFAMPGHKGKIGFSTTAIGRELYKNFIDIDITEVEGVDNLHNAEGIIKEAEEYLAKLYGSEKAYFLVNGSTSGNLAMIFSTFNEGDKVIIERNCHKSIFNGVILRKLNPVYVKNKINFKYDAPLSIDEEHFLHVLEANKDAKGIIVTYPNYYGICPNLRFIIHEAKKRNMKVLVDSAHGAHFGISKELPESAVSLGADMVVMSSHKTLPSLTQTAYLHLANTVDIDRVRFYLNMFLSTSPSYMLMCSMDYGRFYLEEYGEEDYKKLINIANKYREKINRLKGIHVIGKEDFKYVGGAIDLSRYVINLEKRYNARKLLRYLRCNKIQAEMNDNQNVVLIFSPFNTEEEFERLYQVLKDCHMDNLKDEYYNISNYNIPESRLLPYEVIDKNKEYISLEDAKGEICAEAIVPYPPGIPIVTLGEVIGQEAITIIEYYLNSGVEVLGITNVDGKRKVRAVNS
ncbi:aminotransferase class V-fold PLP-dependent enzyme [Clostridium bovifaecis]|uniref:Aminotransferase class V-fold PLP-dependent enzyme n=1 Tax=Clostridium bovifaecis TaxID=2184719 RepID=A0A6I6EMZ0_9CLOT|nr:aminotransferase class V-fold PLP-dependent enzyme [Clostridium bovifaecis]